MSDIFCVTKLDDISDKLKKELLLTQAVDEKILNVFSYRKSGILNLTEVLVGYYRLHGEEKTRQYMMVACYRLVKKKFLAPTKRKGEYKITDLGKSVNPNHAERKRNE